VLQRASISRVTWTGTINILTSGDYRFYSVLQGAQLNLSIGAVGETSISVRAEAFEAESIATSALKDTLIHDLQSIREQLRRVHSTDATRDQASQDAKMAESLLPLEHLARR
jgi:environmental stress-induced protein Ves